MLKNEKSLVDIFIFGSAVKNKKEPSDIDIVSLFRQRDYKIIEDINYQIKKEGDRQNLAVHIEPLIVDDILQSEAYRNIIHEGFSINHMKSVQSLLHFDSFLLLRYNLKNKTPSEKVMFSYALFGREKGKGVLGELKGMELGKGSIAVPVKKEVDILSFFKQWNVDIRKQRILLLS